jgi:hypothetical protein
LLTGLVGALLGLPSLRVRHDFLVLVTMGINFVVVAIFNYVEFFGGALGVIDIPTPRFFAWRDSYLVLVWLYVLSLGICWYLSRRGGMALQRSLDRARPFRSSACPVQDHRLRARGPGRRGSLSPTISRAFSRLVQLPESSSSSQCWLTAAHRCPIFNHRLARLAGIARPAGLPLHGLRRTAGANDVVPTHGLLGDESACGVG